jgi:PAS domain S-box-containing protein
MNEQNEPWNRQIDMKKPSQSTESATPQATALRQRAEARARQKAVQSPENLETLSPEETRRTLLELHVHQVELEMQNEELRRAQAELDAARARYFDLYDLAPMGYVTVSEQGLILETNLTAATLLGVARGALVKQPISQFILKEDEDIHYLHRKRLFETGEPQTYELRMVRKDGTAFWAQLSATAAQDANGAPVCRVVMSNITTLKQTEAALRKALSDVRTLRGIVPICANCKKIRDDQGYWNQVEVYVRNHTEAEFSHGFCPECIKKLYPEFEPDDPGSAPQSTGGSP